VIQRFAKDKIESRTISATWKFVKCQDTFPVAFPIALIAEHDFPPEADQATA
jgi:hypothetical protein